MSENATETARQRELDRAVGADVSPDTAGQVFAVVDALNGSSAVRRALSDPGASAEARGQLARRLFGGKVNEQTMAVLDKAAGLRWGTAGQLMEALERQGVRLQFDAAQRVGSLDRVTDELFKVARTVAETPELASVLNNSAGSLEGRQAVVGRLLQGKADPATVQLAQRALAASEGTFQHTIDHYLEIAADLRNRYVAHVTVARALDDEQTARMKAALTRLAGRDIDMQVYLDPTVVGGARVELGDQVIEGTVSGRLEQLRRNFTN